MQARKLPMVYLNSCTNICNIHCRDFRSHVMFLVFVLVFSSCDWDKISATNAISKEKICFISYCGGFSPWPFGPMDLTVEENGFFLTGREGKGRKGDREGGWVGGRACECEHGQTKDKIPPRTCPRIPNFSS